MEDLESAVDQGCLLITFLCCRQSIIFSVYVNRSHWCSYNFTYRSSVPFWNSDIVAISFLNMCFWGANLSFCSFLVILKGRPAWWHDDVPLRHYSLPSRLHCVNDTGVLNVNLKPKYSDKPIGPPTVNSLSALLADSLYRHFTNSVCNVMPTGSCIKDVRLKWAREVCVKTGQQWMWCVGSASAHSITGGVKDALLTTNSPWQLMTLILYGTEAG